MLDDTGTMAAADAALVAPPPESPEAPAAPAAPEAAPESATQPRDAQGRFTSTPPAEPAAPDTEGAPAPPPEPAGEPIAEPPAEGAQDTYPEFSYRADGQDLSIPGSAVGEDGVFIPADRLSEVQQLLSEGRASRGSVRQRFSELAQREQAALTRAAAAEAERSQTLSHFESLIERSQGAIASGDGTQILQSPIGQWLMGVGQNWPVLKADAAVKAQELLRQAEQQELTRYREQERLTQLRPLMDATLEQSVWQYGATAGLDDAAMAEVYQLLHEPRYEGLAFVKAPYDDPVQGIRQGELVIDYGVVEGAVRLAAAGRTPQKAIAEAQQRNMARQTAVKVPPTVGGKGAKAPQAGPAIPRPKTREEADLLLTEGDLSWAEPTA